MKKQDVNVGGETKVAELGTKGECSDAENCTGRD